MRILEKNKYVGFDTQYIFDGKSITEGEFDKLVNGVCDGRDVNSLQGYEKMWWYIK